MIKTAYDVVVVGGAIGGLSAAKSCIEHGLNTVIVEEHSSIGYPLQCGEVFHREMIHELELREKDVIVNEPKNVKIISPSGKEIFVTFKGTNVPLVFINRKKLERKLAINIVTMGGEIYTRTPALDLVKNNGFVDGVVVYNIDKKVKIKSKIVIAADGAKSDMARKAGINVYRNVHQFDICMQYQIANTDVSNDTAEIYILDPALTGYLWIFPKGESVVNIGVGMNGSYGNLVKSYLDKFLRKDKRFEHSNILEINTGIVPLSGDVDKLVDNGIMLVGDAGRMVNPATGGGTVYAIKSGLCAGKIASEAIDNMDYSAEYLRKYERLWKENIGKHMDGFNVLKNIFLGLSIKEIDEIFKIISHIELSLTERKEVWYEVLKTLLKVILRKPSIAIKFRKVIPYFI